MSEQQPNDGGPAFPNYGPDKVFDRTTATGGMSLRDWFAAQALNGMLCQISDQAMQSIQLTKNPEQFIAMTAKAAFNLADAMLAERAKGGNQ